ncbi:hypothetical protein BCV70DRAFT_200726 [Testicularia cyperi]|uniref:Uncharacterized protein n=1 Tax=Testicularia cyperi TaxID=1882483 RepID=A0A317XNC8_9BASI|nr:hypothetical protein BCV70DRAFT_200726 [Testicularia cyperi]
MRAGATTTSTPSVPSFSHPQPPERAERVAIVPPCATSQIRYRFSTRLSMVATPGVICAPSTMHVAILFAFSPL